MWLGWLGLGSGVAKISRLTGFRPSTLYRVFRDKLTTAADLRDLDVIESAFHQPVGGPDRNFRHAEASMTRFWLGHRLGWKQPTSYDQARNKVEIDLDRLSDEELHELDRIISRASDKAEVREARRHRLSDQTRKCVPSLGRHSSIAASIGPFTHGNCPVGRKPSKLRNDGKPTHQERANRVGNQRVAPRPRRTGRAQRSDRAG